MLSIIDLRVEFGDRILFERASLDLVPGARYGLVGANGSGKTTFFKILCKDIPPSGGEVVVQGGATLGILMQESTPFVDIPIRDIVTMGKRVLWDTLVEKEDLLSKSEMTIEEMEKIADLETVIEREGGYVADSEIEHLLVGLGIPLEKHGHRLKELSSGQRIRVMLARLLFSDPDVLLLDEPTNYLDISSITWLEKYLRNFPGTVILSSHDRAFLNRVVSHIIDIDYQTIKVYKGDFETFWEKKLEDMELRGSQLEKAGKKQADIQKFINRFRAKSSKARQAQSKMHLIKKLEKEKSAYELPPSSRKYPNFAFVTHKKSGAMPLVVRDLSKSYGKKKVLSDVSFEVLKGQKIAIIGPNGIGKSTLLEVIMGNRSADSGTIEWGHGADVSFFPQNIEEKVPNSETMLHFLEGENIGKNVTQLRGALGKMLFSADQIDLKIGALSGGEKARLYFAKIMLEERNILVLDEPTNHLDMESVETLASAVADYNGTIIFVSHNRHFIHLAADRILEIDHSQVIDYKGDINNYTQKEISDSSNAKKATKMAPKKVSKGGSKKLEKELETCEVALEKVRHIMSDPKFYSEKTACERDEILNTFNTLENKMQTLYNEWEKH